MKLTITVKKTASGFRACVKAKGTKPVCGGDFNKWFAIEEAVKNYARKSK